MLGSQGLLHVTCLPPRRQQSELGTTFKQEIARGRPLGKMKEFLTCMHVCKHVISSVYWKWGPPITNLSYDLCAYMGAVLPRINSWLADASFNQRARNLGLALTRRVLTKEHIHNQQVLLLIQTRYSTTRVISSMLLSMLLSSIS